MIRFENVFFAYRSAGITRAALAAVTLEVREGESVAVVGANGSGKSTLVRLVNGLLLPSSGSVTVDGMQTSDDRRATDVRSRIGMVFQRPDDQIVATTVEDEVAFGPENLGLSRGEIRQRVDESLAAVGLAGLENREPHLLSGGQKQRLAIAGALAMRPRYLVLDEPTSMIDPQGRREVREVLARLRTEGRGVLLVTHDLLEAAPCDRVVALDRGTVAYDGPPEGLLADADSLRRLGLELPALFRLGGELRRLGAPVPQRYRGPDELAEALWR